MDTQQNQVLQDTEKLKEIPKWTRRYAQNRTLTLLALVVITLLFSIGTAFTLALGIAAFQKGNMILASICIVVLIATLICLGLVIIRAKKSGGINIERWIYGRKGTVSIPKPELTKKEKWLESAVSVVSFGLFIGTIYLGMKGYISAKYIQPVMALYYVPYMVFMWYFSQKPKFGPVMLLWPILYTIHAILIIAGVPIFFTGQYGVVLNIFLPWSGYGFLTYIIGHFYGRYALKKLKDITHLDGDLPNGV
jgi:hypothetical protein